MRRLDCASGEHGPEYESACSCALKKSVTTNHPERSPEGQQKRAQFDYIIDVVIDPFKHCLPLDMNGTERNVIWPVGPAL